LLWGSGDLLGRLDNWVQDREFNARLPAREREAIARNRDLKGLYEGSTAVVIGNGPSLKEDPLLFAPNVRTFVCNAFWKHPLATSLDPDVYVVTHGSLFNHSEGSREFLVESSRVCPGSLFFVPSSGLEFARECLRGPQIAAIAQNGYMPTWKVGTLDLTRVVPFVPTVVQTAVIIALYLGCAEIVLLGCDHNWLDDFGHDDHFYAGETAGTDALPAEELPIRSHYSRMLGYVSAVWESYRQLEAIATRNGARIRNATPGSRLDLFAPPRVEFRLDTRKLQPEIEERSGRGAGPT